MNVLVDLIGSTPLYSQLSVGAGVLADPSFRAPSQPLRMVVRGARVERRERAVRRGAHARVLPPLPRDHVVDGLRRGVDGREFGRVEPPHREAEEVAQFRHHVHGPREVVRLDREQLRAREYCGPAVELLGV